MSAPGVLLVHNRYRERGGEDVAFEAEARLLRERGHRVRTLEADNRALHPGPGAAAGALWSRRSAAELRARVDGSVSVAHFHNTFPRLSPSVLHAARGAGLAVVQTLHNFRLLCPDGLLYADGAPCERCLGRALAWPGVARGCYRGDRAATAAAALVVGAHRVAGTWRRAVDRYVVLSEFARGRFVAGGLPEERIAVLPNFLPEDPGVGDHAGGFALFVGRLSEEKGIGTLLDAWRSLGDAVPLVVAGSGPLEDRLRAAPPGVEWRGSLPGGEVLELMRRATLLVAPSLCYENSPLSVLEAFAAGLPVVGSARGSVGELLAGGGGVAVDPSSPGELAAAVLGLWSSPDERARRGLLARRAYEESHTPERHYRGLLRVYAEAAAQRYAALPSTSCPAPCHPEKASRRSPQANGALPGVIV